METAQNHLMPRVPNGRGLAMDHMSARRAARTPFVPFRGSRRGHRETSSAGKLSGSDGDIPLDGRAITFTHSPCRKGSSYLWDQSCSRHIRWPIDMAAPPAIGPD